MKYYVDIDGTICDTTPHDRDSDTFPDYMDSVPIFDRIKQINALYDQGHEIHYWTARGTVSGIDWIDQTIDQLDEWGVRYTTIATGKPDYDIWIDDKAREAKVYFEELTSE